MKKYFYIICAILIILLSILFILLFNLKKQKNEEVKEEETAITVKGKDVSFELNGKIFPENYLNFQNDTRDLEIEYKQIYTELYKLVKNSEKLNSDTKKLSDGEIKKYYTQNKTEIKEMGILSETDFNNLIKLLKNIYIGNDIYYRNVEMLKKDNAKYEIFIEYNNDKVIRLKLSNLEADTNVYGFIPVIEE
ncbi:MAG: hypothetical protein IKD76_04480 [Clostridia bacterium]|nr:hypothetical protein [Clostridia bacterium]